MLDIKVIRDDPEEVKRLLKAKEVDCDEAIDRILALDTQRRELIYKTETAKSEQNKVSKQIPAMKKAGEDVSAVLAEMNALKESIKGYDVALRSVEEEYRGLMLGLPNLPDPDLAPGGKENNEPLRYFGEKHSFDFEAAGYNLCITDTKGSHSDLTDDYVAVPAEMKEVAAHFGKPYLREVDEKAFFSAIPELHGSVSDRAILRAIHFFGENRRAIQEADALERGDLERFFTLYRQSADSSANLLQNLYSTKKPLEQGIPLALAVSRAILGENSDVRVHGGGFAGTIQAFVPLDKTDVYREKMDALFGEGSCYVLRIRPVGGVKII